MTKSGTQDLHSIAFGDPSAAWEAAADVSAETHIRDLRSPVRRVLSLIPAKYDDMWTGAKGFHKVEPIVADGGQVVLDAPHIREITVATGIPEDVTRSINLDYLDPAEVDPVAWATDPDTLVVPNAGADLYRLR